MNSIGNLPKSTSMPTPDSLENIGILRQIINHDLGQIESIYQAENLDALCQEAITHFPLTELAQLASFFEMSPFLSILVEKIMEKYILNNEEGERNCIIFIDQVQSMIDRKASKKPAVIGILLQKLIEMNSLEKFIINPLEEYDNDSFILILWSLPSIHLSNLIAQFNSDSNPFEITQILNELFVIETNPEECSKLVTAFTNLMDIDQLEVFIRTLINTSSPAIPFLMTGLKDAHFEPFITTFPRHLRHEIFEKSVSYCGLDMRWIFENLGNRLLTICDHSEYNRISQEIVYVDGILQPQYMTIKKLIHTIENNDPDHLSLYFSEEIKATAPYLIALAFHHPLYKYQISKIGKIFSKTQLQAISLGISEGEVATDVDLICEQLQTDQIPIILDYLRLNILEKYFKHLYGRILPKYQEISEWNKEENFESLCELQLKVRQILSPFNITIKKYIESLLPNWSKFFNEEPVLIPLLNSCHRINLKTEKQLENLRKIIPPDQTEILSIHPLIKTDTLKKLGIDSLDQLGIKSSEDLQLLGITNDKEFIEKIESYVKQEALESIWILLRSKRLYTLSSLKESCLIEENEELFDLKQLAKKFRSNP